LGEWLAIIRAFRQAAIITNVSSALDFIRQRYVGEVI
jgi:hypothetical protein